MWTVYHLSLWCCARCSHKHLHARAVAGKHFFRKKTRRKTEHGTGSRTRNTSHALLIMSLSWSTLQAILTCTHTQTRQTGAHRSVSTLQAILAHTQTRQVHTGVLFHFVIMLSVFFVYFNLTLSENDFLRKDNRGSVVYVCI